MLGSYLNREVRAPGDEFRLVVKTRNPLTFYVHPLGRDGETRDFEVTRDGHCMPDATLEPAPEAKPQP
jgi:hypothetical protein